MSRARLQPDEAVEAAPRGVDGGGARTGLPGLVYMGSRRRVLGRVGLRRRRRWRGGSRRCVLGRVGLRGRRRWRGGLGAAPRSAMALGLFATKPELNALEERLDLRGIAQLHAEAEQEHVAALLAVLNLQRQGCEGRMHGGRDPDPLAVHGFGSPSPDVAREGSDLFRRRCGEPLHEERGDLSFGQWTPGVAKLDKA